MTNLDELEAHLKQPHMILGKRDGLDLIAELRAARKVVEAVDAVLPFLPQTRLKGEHCRASIALRQARMDYDALTGERGRA